MIYLPLNIFYFFITIIKYKIHIESMYFEINQDPLLFQ
jgi:hypothetical protein